jgi:hypothetical protein
MDKLQWKNKDKSIKGSGTRTNAPGTTTKTNALGGGSLATPSSFTSGNQIPPRSSKPSEVRSLFIVAKKDASLTCTSTFFLPISSSQKMITLGDDIEEDELNIGRKPTNRATNSKSNLPGVVASDAARQGFKPLTMLSNSSALPSTSTSTTPRSKFEVGPKKKSSSSSSMMNAVRKKAVAGTAGQNALLAAEKRKTNVNLNANYDTASVGVKRLFDRGQEFGEKIVSASRTAQEDALPVVPRAQSAAEHNAKFKSSSSKVGTQASTSAGSGPKVKTVASRSASKYAYEEVPDTSSSQSPSNFASTSKSKLKSPSRTASKSDDEPLDLRFHDDSSQPSASDSQQKELPVLVPPSESEESDEDGEFKAFLVKQAEDAKKGERKETQAKAKVSRPQMRLENEDKGKSKKSRSKRAVLSESDLEVTEVENISRTLPSRQQPTATEVDEANPWVGGYSSFDHPSSPRRQSDYEPFDEVMEDTESQRRPLSPIHENGIIERDDATTPIKVVPVKNGKGKAKEQAGVIDIPDSPKVKKGKRRLAPDTEVEEPRPKGKEKSKEKSIQATLPFAKERPSKEDAVLVKKVCR